MTQSPSDVSTGAFNWIFQRSDGAGFAATSHDRAQHFESMVLEPSLDVSPSEMVLSDQMYGSTLALEGGLSSPALTSRDLAAGRWNGAAIKLLASDWMQGSEPISICEGELGKAAVREGRMSMTVDLLPAATRLTPCVQTSPECRAVLGDRQCRVDMRMRQRRVCVLSAEGTELTLDSPDTANLGMGRLRWIRSANCGTEQTILVADGTKLVLQDVPSEAVQAGDRAIVREGCDGLRATCSDRFGNIVNFRGEPDLPGSEILLRFPGA